MRFLIAILLASTICSTAWGASQLKHTVAPSGGDFTSLDAAIDHLVASHADLVSADVYADVEISGTWSSADTTRATFGAITTDATRYINIYTVSDARHSGVWSTTAYRLEIDSYQNAIDSSGSLYYITIDGLQVYTYKAEDAFGNKAIYWYATGGNGNVTFKNNILKCYNGDGFELTLGGTSNAYVYNNIIYTSTSNKQGMSCNVVDFNANFYYINNTVYGFSNGISSCGGNHITAKNNISYDNTSDYVNTFNSNSTHNLASDTTTPEYNTYYDSKTLTFTNTTAGSEDFHLVSGDTDAIDKGTDLSGTFTTDIDGTTRSGTWDIGADEYVVSGVPISTVIKLDGVRLSGVTIK